MRPYLSRVGGSTMGSLIRPLLGALLLLSASPAVAGPVLAPLTAVELNKLAVVHGVVLGLPADGACATVAVELERDAVASPRQAAACADSSGAASFAIPLHFAGAGERLARVVVTQEPAPTSPGRVWQQLVIARGSVALRVDMREGQETAPPPAPPEPASVPELAQQAPPVLLEPSSTPALPGGSSPCTCPRRAYIELEDFGDRSLPALRALAIRPAPTCLPPPAPPAEQQLHVPPQPSLLLPGLGSACALQAAVLAVLLLRRSGGSSRAEAAGDSSVQAGEEEEQLGAARAAGRCISVSLRDACTSPLVALLASPFVGSKRQGSCEELATIPESLEAGSEEAEAEQHQVWGRSQGQGQQRPGGGSHRSSFSTLPPPPTGWNRDAWGRLQRQSGGSRYKPAGGVQHPPPFGSTPGSTYRSQSATSEE